MVVSFIRVMNDKTEGGSNGNVVHKRAEAQTRSHKHEKCSS